LDTRFWLLDKVDRCRTDNNPGGVWQNGEMIKYFPENGGKNNP